MDLDDSILREQAADPVSWEGRFTKDAATEDDELFVTVEGYDGGEHEFGPLVWQPHGATLPDAGDLALIVQSDQGRWWVTVWIES